MHRIRSLTPAVLLTALALSACGGEAAQGPESTALRIGIANDVLTFDPHNYRSTNDLSVQGLIYDTLVTHDQDGEIVPSLATEWNAVDSTTWEFTLRPNVKFSDGTPFDGEAVKASLERGSDAPRGSGYLGMIESVEVVEPLKVQVKLEYPFAPLLGNLAYPVASIVSPKLIETYETDMLPTAAGTGRYLLKNWTPNSVTTLDRNPEYWGERPAFDSIQFRPIPEDTTRWDALQSGQLDMIQNPPPEQREALENSDSLQPLITPAARTVFLGFNLKDETLGDNLALRQAIASAIDKEQIVTTVLEGIGRPAVDGFIDPTVMETEPPINIPFDLARAKQLMSEAGLADGVALKFDIPVARYLKDQQVAQVIQTQLAEIGVDVELNPLEFGALLDVTTKHQSQLFYMGWGFSTGDPDQPLHQIFYTDDPYNMTAYSNPAYDRLLTKSQRAEAGSDERQQMFWDLQKMILEEDTLVVPIYYMQNYFAATKRLEGMRVTPLELYDISQARFVD